MVDICEGRLAQLLQERDVHATPRILIMQGDRIPLQTHSASQPFLSEDDSLIACPSIINAMVTVVPKR